MKSGISARFSSRSLSLQRKEAKILAKISNVHLFRSLSVETMEFSLPSILTDPKKWEALFQLRLFGPLLFGLNLKDMRRAYQI